MRILFTIPHYYAPDGRARHGSLAGSADRRRGYVLACLSRLHETFGGWQRLTHSAHPFGGIEANQALRHDIDVVVCTTQGRHLLDGLPPGLCRHHQVQTTEPRLLGYDCHAVLRNGLGSYDWYCFLEDDLLLADPLFFAKLQWFLDFAGDDAVLLPNRFERDVARKLYVDGALRAPVSAGFQDRGDRPVLESSVLGLSLALSRVDNPHAGCFFLSEAQMRHWSLQPWFLDRSAAFWGPLESAATLGLMRTFRVYKPARRNAGFLELLHADNRNLRLP